MNKDEILRRGYVITKVTVSGVRQTHRLNVVKEKSGAGYFHFLTGRFKIPQNEMLRLAEEFQLPVKSGDTFVFPKGKSKRDFVEVTFEPDTVMAEVED